MKSPLDQLVQRLEQITQQLKMLETVLGSASKTSHHGLLADWKGIRLRRDVIHADPTNELPTDPFQAQPDPAED